MKLPVSNLAIIIAAVSLVVELAIVIYTDVQDIPYDAQGLEGLIFWAGGLWVFPILGVITLLISFIRNRNRRRDFGK